LFGEHRNPAFFLAWGAGVPASTMEPRAVASIDVAPTILARLQLPIAEDMPGRTRGDLMSLPAAAPKVATYRLKEATKALPNEALFDPRRMQQLEALGYIDDQGQPIDTVTGGERPARPPAPPGP
jgi:hypothetical protein